MGVFGAANGVLSEAGLRASIGRYRKAPLTDDDDPEIGCVLLRDAGFPAETAAAPADFASNIVRGKRYDLVHGSHIEESLAFLLARHDPSVGAPPRMFGDPTLIRPRLGQQAFAAMVLTAYQRRCAITGDRIRPTLQAAHIRPVASEGQHRLDNGLMLRSDVHTLLDRGYLSVDPRLRIHVSRRLLQEFGNGEQLYRRHGQTLTVIPSSRRDQPDPKAPEWHLDTVFRAS